jgi:hypothetical protein
MRRHFTSYWRWDTVQQNWDDRWDGGHIAGQQLGKLESGDVVWIVSVVQGRLYLVGRVEVGQVVNQSEAERILRNPLLWRASYHVIAAKGTKQPMKKIDATLLAHQLRFESSTAERLTVTPRGVDVQQVRSMRRLTPTSVILLEDAWRRG